MSVDSNRKYDNMSVNFLSFLRIFNQLTLVLFVLISPNERKKNSPCTGEPVFIVYLDDSRN